MKRYKLDPDKPYAVRKDGHILFAPQKLTRWGKFLSLFQRGHKDVPSLEVHASEGMRYSRGHRGG